MAFASKLWDRFQRMLKTNVSALNEPASGLFAITAADSDLATPARGLYIGTAGTLKVTMIDDSIDTLVTAVVGYHPLMVKRVWAESTAEDIHGCK